MENTADLATFLEEKYETYNRPSFIVDDPISIPHAFERKEDIEIAGFLAALIAWGKRSMIVKNGERLMAVMDWKPYDFVMQADEVSLSRLDSFVHRTFQPVDAVGMLLALRKVYQEDGGLEQIFCEGIREDDRDIFGGIMNARQKLIASAHFPARTQKHLANPSKGSAAKRINMFLRWMVRQDKRGVDFGIWKGIRMDQLVCPLDVHSGNVARALGLLKRKQNDWKAALALTDALKSFDAQDPIRYDFSLFGLGVNEGWRHLITM